MAGHSKWANIQHRKGAQDAKRGKLFTKLIKEVTVAARLGGGGDPDMNPRLRQAIDRCLASNMPKDNIERGIKRGTGELEGVDYTEVRFEGYGPSGIALIVDCMTDNNNRTVSDVRHVFSKYGGKMGTDGSVAYMFHKVGVISFEKGMDEDAIMEVAINAGAEDILSHEDGSLEILTKWEDLTMVSTALQGADFPPAHAEATLRPENMIDLDALGTEKFLRLLGAMEDLDDVQNVYSNANLDDATLEALG